jgi:NADPH:quinone reductase-like Zn-dependent oxidoreductase
LQAGAAHVIATEEKDVEEEVKRLTNGKGAASCLKFWKRSSMSGQASV